MFQGKKREYQEAIINELEKAVRTRISCNCIGASVTLRAVISLELT
jgi:hypothetical protein